MKFRSVFVLLIPVLCLGCGGDSNPSENEENTKSQEKPEVKEDLGPPLEGEPTVEIWDWDQTLAAVQAHSGKVVVVHLWATWAETLDNPEDQASPEVLAKKKELLNKCGFEEFVRMKKLHRDDVVAISLNTDFNGGNGPPETFKDAVTEFTQKHGANFEHGIASVPDETLQEELEIIGMPSVLVFDKAGELQHTFYNDLYEDLPPDEQKSFSYRDDVIPAAKKLISEPYEPTETSKAETPAPNSETVSVQTGDWETVQSLVTKNAGKVVVVDLWSTTCEPCLREFPNLVELHASQEKNVACIAFNMDYTGAGKPEDLKPTIEKVLTSLKATFPNVLSSQTDEQIYEQLEIYSLPAVFVYNVDGKLSKQFGTTGEFTYKDDVLPFVNSLIEAN